MISLRSSGIGSCGVSPVGKIMLPIIDIRIMRCSSVMPSSFLSAFQTTLPVGSWSFASGLALATELTVWLARLSLFITFVQASVMFSKILVSTPKFLAAFCLPRVQVSGTAALTIPLAASHESMFRRLAAWAVACRACITLSQVGHRFWIASLKP